MHKKPKRSFHRPSILESEVVRYIQSNLGGEVEVYLGYSFADLVIKDTIFEVKKFERWKELLGQMIVHKFVYPTRPIRGIVFCHAHCFPPHNLNFVKKVFKSFGFKIWVVTDAFIRKRLSRSSAKNSK